MRVYLSAAVCYYSILMHSNQSHLQLALIADLLDTWLPLLCFAFACQTWLPGWIKVMSIKKKNLKKESEAFPASVLIPFPPPLPWLISRLVGLIIILFASWMSVSYLDRGAVQLEIMLYWDYAWRAMSSCSWTSQGCWWDVFEDYLWCWWNRSLNSVSISNILK